MLIRSFAVLCLIAAGFVLFALPVAGDFTHAPGRLATEIGREFKTAVYGVADWLSRIIGV